MSKIYKVKPKVNHQTDYRNEGGAYDYNYRFVFSDDLRDWTGEKRREQKIGIQERHKEIKKLRRKKKRDCSQFSSV